MATPIDAATALQQMREQGQQKFDEMTPHQQEVVRRFATAFADDVTQTAVTKYPENGTDSVAAHHYHADKQALATDLIAKFVSDGLEPKAALRKLECLQDAQALLPVANHPVPAAAAACDAMTPNAPVLPASGARGAHR